MKDIVRCGSGMVVTAAAAGHVTLVAEPDASHGAVSLTFSPDQARALAYLLRRDADAAEQR